MKSDNTADGKPSQPYLRYVYGLNLSASENTDCDDESRTVQSDSKVSARKFAPVWWTRTRRNTIDAPESNKINEIIHVLRIGSIGKRVEVMIHPHRCLFSKPNMFSIPSNTDESFPAPTHPAQRVILIFSTFLRHSRENWTWKGFSFKNFLFTCDLGSRFCAIAAHWNFQNFSLLLYYIRKTFYCDVLYICGVLLLPLT